MFRKSPDTHDAPVPISNKSQYGCRVAETAHRFLHQVNSISNAIFNPSLPSTSLLTSPTLLFPTSLSPRPTISSLPRISPSPTFSFSLPSLLSAAPFPGSVSGTRLIPWASCLVLCCPGDVLLMFLLRPCVLRERSVASLLCAGLMLCPVVPWTLLSHALISFFFVLPCGFVLPRPSASRHLAVSFGLPSSCVLLCPAL